jgi:hypothetical protein
VDDSPALRIGRLSGTHIIVRPTRRANPEARDYWDGNCLYATIDIAAGAFRGDFEALIYAWEFVRFRDQLRPLHVKLVGGAAFDTMEGWLKVEIEGDGKGHFRAACVAFDQPGVGNRLTFGIDFDQTELPEVLHGLDAICEAFPVVGKP